MCTASAAVLTALGLAVPSLSSSVAAAAAPHAAARSALAVPSLPAGARVLRTTSPDARLAASIFLRPRAPGALGAFAAAVGDEHSPQFGRYLGRGAFARRFGPARSTIDRVERFLRGAGLHVLGLSSNHLAIQVAGRAQTFESAFRTRLADVALARGALGRTTTTPLQLPSGVASAVVAVLGLDHLVAMRSALVRPHGVRRTTAVREGADRAQIAPGVPGAPSACASAQQTSLGQHGVTDDQVAHAYGADGLYAAGDLGGGQTVAILELEPFARADVQAFDACYFGASHLSQVRTVNVDGGPGTGVGSGEAALDIEVVSALAPAATIRVYQAPNTAPGTIDAYNQIVSDDTARVATTSWGLCEGDMLRYEPGALAAENFIFEQAAAQGQSFFSASGDSGNDACAYQDPYPTQPVKSVEDPGSQPYVVGVGGTTAVSTSQPPAETVWNDGAGAGGTGGGISSIWREPPWASAAAKAQSSRAPCAAPSHATCRTVPDVASFADELRGIGVYWYGGWNSFGGTSWGAPTWAALLAVVNASPTCQSSPTTARGVGFVAPLLYEVAAVPRSYANGFNDVKVGDNDIFGVTGGLYRARPGYDLASGLGTPQLTASPGTPGPGLAESLCTAAQGASSVRLGTVTPSQGATLGGTPFTLTGSGFAPGGRSDVRQVDFGLTPVASFTVVSDTKITGTTSAAPAPTSVTLLDRLTRHSSEDLVTVTTTAGAVAAGPTFHFVVGTSGYAVPSVTSIGPTGGTGRGGMRVNIYGTGFTGARRVTFGGVTAPTFRVVSDDLLVVVTPPWRRSMCRTHSVRTLDGLCQTAVRVFGRGGASAVARVLPPVAGSLQFNRLGVLVLPPGCGCEGYPSVTEFDYVTRLSLHSVTSVRGRRVLGDPGGGDVLRLAGTGFNVLTLDWINFGPASSAASQTVNVVRISPTGKWIDVVSPDDQTPSPAGNVVAVSITTMAGNSDRRTFRYQPIPHITWLSTDVLPAAGYARLVIRGGGFRYAAVVLFDPVLPTLPDAEVARFRSRTTSEIVMTSPNVAPGAYVVSVCGTWVCGPSTAPKPVDNTVQIIDPSSTAVTSAELVPGGAAPSGPAAGGTTFEIQGTNFGPLSQLHVEFQDVSGATVPAATAIVAGPAPTDPGATETLLVVSPASPTGSPGYFSVLLSGANGTSSVTPTAGFTYTT
ncbi:MAG TPA: IPT/TIG domain-containing protein [Acidimicrobiales bacterium]|nr:IPT/TIG domain-containing protein [Acidimicrobiales bacterium]